MAIENNAMAIFNGLSKDDIARNCIKIIEQSPANPPDMILSNFRPFIIMKYLKMDDKLNNHRLSL